jgi:prepilin-type N-terminal cleavage/methylation domain-containing protein
MQNKGFTLIELLVVIAIIGILAGIIVVSMGSAQKSAQDAKIQATLDQMRTAAQMYYLTNNNYGTNSALVTTTTSSCTGASTMSVSGQNFYTLCDSLSTKPIVSVAASGASFCAYSQLSAPSTTTYWCVDSNGNSKSITSTTTCAAGTGC